MGERRFILVSSKAWTLLLYLQDSGSPRVGHSGSLRGVAMWQQYLSVVLTAREVAMKLVSVWAGGKI